MATAILRRHEVKEEKVQERRSKRPALEHILPSIQSEQHEPKSYADPILLPAMESPLPEYGKINTSKAKSSRPHPYKRKKEEKHVEKDEKKNKHEPEPSFSFQISTADPTPTALSTYIPHLYEPLPCTICAKAGITLKRVPIDDTIPGSLRLAVMCADCLKMHPGALTQLAQMYDEARHNYVMSSWTGKEVDFIRSSGQPQRGTIASIRISASSLHAIVVWTKAPSKFSKGVRCATLARTNSHLPPLCISFHPSTPPSALSEHRKHLAQVIEATLVVSPSVK